MARPSVPGECSICFHRVSSMKVLSCTHKFCINCCITTAAEDSEQGTQKIRCPVCRQVSTFTSINSLPTLYIGSLQCNLCGETHKSKDMWWCPTCVQIICSTCYIKDHQRTGHTSYEWDTLQIVKDISHVSQVQEKAATKKPIVFNRDEHTIAQLLKGIQESLLGKLQQAQPKAKLPFHKFMEEHFGQAHQTDASSVNLSENGDRLTRVTDQMVKLALDDSEEVWQRYAQPYPTKIAHLAIDNFEDDVETFTDNIWLKIKLERVEKVLSFDSYDVRTTPNYTGEDLKQLVRKDQGEILSGWNYFDWNDEFLDSVPPDYVLPDSLQKCDYWVYRGTGCNFEKFLNIYRINTRAPITIAIRAERRWLPVNLSNTDSIEKIKYLGIELPHVLSQQSEENFVQFICHLCIPRIYPQNKFTFKRLLPSLDDIYVNSFGHVFRTIETGAVWNQLPNSVQTIGILNIPLSENGRHTITKFIQHRKISGLTISYDNNSWESLLLFVRQLKNIKLEKLQNVPCINLTDRISGRGAEVFGKFLQEFVQWDFEHRLVLRDFRLSNMHVEKLLKKIPSMKKVKLLELFKTKVEKVNVEKVRKECKRNLIEFI